MESLRRYVSRATYVQRGLYHLFNISQDFRTPRTDVIKVRDGVVTFSCFEPQTVKNRVRSGLEQPGTFPVSESCSSIVIFVTDYIFGS